MDWTVVVITLPWLTAALGCWIMYQILQQNRRIFERLEFLADEVDDYVGLEGPAGMKVGAKAPGFALPGLDGDTVSLEQFRGRWVLVYFVGPTCEHTRRLLPGLAPLPLDGREGRPQLILVSTGDVEANRAMARDFGLRCPVLIQEGWKVAGGYGVNGSPMGYLINEEGEIASDVTMGPEALLALARGDEAGWQKAQEDVRALLRQKAQERLAAGLGGAGGGRTSNAVDPSSAQTFVGETPPQATPQDGTGVGDLVKKVTDTFGIKPCKGCERRRQALNRWRIRAWGGGASRGSR